MKKIVILLAFVGLFTAQSIAEETVYVKGTVYENSSNKKQPLCMAYVYVDNTVYCTYTDQNGKFELELPKGKHDIKVAFKGYCTKEQKVNIKNTNDTQLKVTLYPKNFAQKK